MLTRPSRYRLGRPDVDRAVQNLPGPSGSQQGRLARRRGRGHAVVGVGMSIWASAHRWESRANDERAMLTTRGPCRRREGRADDGRAVPTTGEPRRRQEGLADDGKHGEVGTVAKMDVVLPDGRGVGGMDVASPGWTWCRRDGRGVAGMDVASPGWTWHIQNGPIKVR